MTPDDPRHGSNAGYLAGCRNDCCRHAAAVYQKRRLYDHLRGRPRKVPAIGARRRIEALFTLGWTYQDMADRLGVSRQAVRCVQRQTMIYTATHNAIAALYDQLSMTVPTGRYATRARNYAARHGYAPPLAWEGLDINDPATAPRLDGPSGDDVDEVVVQRILDGDPTPARTATPAERRVVVAAWAASGRPLRDLTKLTGWKTERYHRLRDEAA